MTPQQLTNELIKQNKLDIEVLKKAFLKHKGVKSNSVIPSIKNNLYRVGTAVLISYIINRMLK